MNLGLKHRKENNMNYTTIEQSKKLLELGLNPDTADMYCTMLTENSKEYSVFVKRKVCRYNIEDGDIPCWSVEALLELIPKHPKFNTVFRFLDSQIDGSYKYVWIFECHAVSEYTFEGTSDFDCIYQAIVWFLQNNYIKTEKK